MSTPSALDYRKIIDSFKARLLTEKDIEQRLSDLMLVFDFSASLNRCSGISEIANLLLLTLMGYTTSRRSVFLMRTKEALEVVAFKGYRSKPEMRITGLELKPPYEDFYAWSETSGTDWTELCEAFDVRLIVPLHHDDRLLGLVGIGNRMESRAFSQHELQIISAIVQLCVSGVLNAETHGMLESLNRQLILKVYQLNTLFELSKDFNAVWDSESIFRILGTSLIGQLLVSRCAVFTFSSGSAVLQFHRGFRFLPEDLQMLKEFDILACLPEKQKPLLFPECKDEALRAFSARHKIHMVFPLVMNDEIRGMIYLSEKKNRKSFLQEDVDFITTLGSLALVSEENGRMQQQMIEKQRMDKELSIARDIQHSLLPHSIPEVPGYAIATAFQPAYQVGGDYFDVIPVSDTELAIAIGDVSGKGTPAAMIMASVQASLRALASMRISDPKITIQRLNELLCKSHGLSNKYVTFFYGVLNFETHRLSYVNAGHCYPLILKAEGKVDQLETGGMVMGFFPDAVYRGAEYELHHGDVLVLYTDGVSELMDPEDEEFGVDRIIESVRLSQEKTVFEIRDYLSEALNHHRKDQKQWDDLTLILLKRN